MPGAPTTPLVLSYACRPKDETPLVQVASADPPADVAAKTELASEITALTPTEEFPLAGQVIDGMTKVAVTVARCFLDGGACAVYPAMVGLDTAGRAPPREDPEIPGAAPAGDDGVAAMRQIQPTDAAVIPANRRRAAWPRLTVSVRGCVFKAIGPPSKASMPPHARAVEIANFLGAIDGSSDPSKLTRKVGREARRLIVAGSPAAAADCHTDVPQVIRRR